MVTREEGLRRLLKLAEILDVADEKHAEDNEPAYDQGRFYHRCGTPACALGHWAAHNPDRWKMVHGVPYLRGQRPHADWGEAREEFGITNVEAAQLFGGYGCGDARNGRQAAKYIRQFVADRCATPAPIQE
jgi:hypothetical protein